MSVKVAEFTRGYLKEASELVYEAQQDEFNSNKINHKVSLDFCEKQIINELNKEVSSSHIILSEGKLAGFAIGIIKKDSIWGNSGWVNIGGWGIKKNQINLLNFLYQKIVENFVDLKIKQHYFQVYDNNKNIGLLVRYYYTKFCNYDNCQFPHYFRYLCRFKIGKKKEILYLKVQELVLLSEYYGFFHMALSWPASVILRLSMN